MTKTQRSRLTGRELAVWAATYAAEYARDFHETREAYGAKLKEKASERRAQAKWDAYCRAGRAKEAR